MDVQAWIETGDQFYSHSLLNTPSILIQWKINTHFISFLLFFSFFFFRKYTVHFPHSCLLLKWHMTPTNAQHTFCIVSTTCSFYSIFLIETCSSTGRNYAYIEAKLHTYVVIWLHFGVFFLLCWFWEKTGDTQRKEKDRVSPEGPWPLAVAGGET